VSEAPTHSFYQDTIPADGPGRCDYTYGDGSRCGLRPDQHPQAEQLQARIAELEAALREVVAVLGPAPLPCCEGCATEVSMALKTAQSALGASP
jgi:hypothetical protein